MPIGSLLTRRGRPALVAAALGLACHQAPRPQAAAALPAHDESFREQVPPSGPPPALHLPEAQERLLANGLQLIVSPRPGRPLVTARLVLRSGSALDPPAREGLAGFVAEILRHGTQRRTAEQVAAEVEDLGSSIDVEVDEDGLVVSATALSQHFAAVFDVLADVTTHPSFPVKEIEWLRHQRQGAIEQAESQPSFVAAQVFRHALFGDHPYGHLALGSHGAIARFSRQDLVGFWSHFFQPGNAALVLAGDITVEQAALAAERGFGRWAGHAKTTPPPVSPRAGLPQVLLVDRPGASQSAVLVGTLGAARKDPDHEALGVLNTILGGSFNSRINMNLREDKAYTYGAYSRFASLRARGSFEVHTRVRSDVTAPAIREILAEIAHIGAADVSDEELLDAKRMIVRSLPGLFQDIGDVARQFGNLWLRDLPVDELSRVRERVEAVTVADVRRLARQALDPASMLVVVVGDAAAVQTDLEALGRGPVVRVSATGVAAAP